MKLKLLLIAVLFHLISGNIIVAQVIIDSKAVVTNIDFNLVNDELVITYDITNSNPGELFKINIKIFNEAGKEINAKSFSGDAGENISVGIQKKAIWEIPKDIAYLDDQIYIEIEAINQNPQIIKPVSKGAAILLSSLWPGLGSSKITFKRYHLLKGVFAYGSIASSFIYKNKATLSGQHYYEATTAIERDKYFEANNDQTRISRLMLYTSAALWVVDYITILASENLTQKEGFKSKIVYLGPAINPSIDFTGMMLIYNF